MIIQKDLYESQVVQILLYFQIFDKLEASQVLYEVLYMVSSDL